jgi:hypothetical protein
MSSTLVVPENVGVAFLITLSFAGLEMLSVGAAAMLAGASPSAHKPARQLAARKRASPRRRGLGDGVRGMPPTIQSDRAAV